MDHSQHNMVSSSASAMSSMTMSAITSATPSAAAHDMSNMDMSGDSSGSSMSMSMSTMGAFHWSSSGDAIWLESWVPESEGAYIGACFGLFFVALLSRSLPAMESYFIAWRGQKNNNVALDNSKVASGNKVNIIIDTLISYSLTHNLFFFFKGCSL